MSRDFGNKQKVALIDSPLEGGSGGVTVRYQYTNHLDSASLELDENANIISYEEYHPFGSTSYRSGRNEVDVSLKRYKYVHKELDRAERKENVQWTFLANEPDCRVGGLYYYGMRYYAAWIARFISVDPLQFDYPHYTPFQYAGNKPISFIDLDGAEERIITYNSQGKRESVVDISNTDIGVFNQLRVGFYESIPNKSLANKSDEFFRNWDKYNKSKLQSGKMIDKNGVWQGPQRGTLHVSTDDEGYPSYVYQPNSADLKPKPVTIGETIQTFGEARNWFMNSDDRHAKGFRSNMRNTAYGAVAVFAAPVIAEYGLAAGTLELGLYKTGISAGIQVAFNNEVNFVSALADGFLVLGIGDAIGSGLSLTYNFQTNKFTSDNIFDGSKDFTDFMIQTSIGTAFGMKTKYLEGLADESVSEGLKYTIFESANQFGNYGLQKSITDKRHD